MSDPYNLQRFVDAQNPVYDAVCAELRRGRKTSHWMWFVFPQIAGLGTSLMARKFALSSPGEVQAYLQHPILGQRLRKCTRLVNAVQGRTIHDIFGSPDDMKFRSCMTLFAHATAENQEFREALQKYYGNQEDALTLERLRIS